MTRKAAWILILLVALTAISASVAFAANSTRLAQAALAPQRISTSGAASVVTLSGISGGAYKFTHTYSSGPGHCHLEESSPAY